MKHSGDNPLIAKSDHVDETERKVNCREPLNNKGGCIEVKGKESGGSDCCEGHIIYTRRFTQL